MAFAEDMSVFFDAGEFALLASWGAYSANVLLDTPDEDVLGGRANSTEYKLTLAATDFPAITRGATVVISGASYTVREVRLVGDGAVKTLTLSKV